MDVDFLFLSLGPCKVSANLGRPVDTLFYGQELLKGKSQLHLGDTDHDEPWGT